MATAEPLSRPRRPRLSLQIKTTCIPPSKGAGGYHLNASDPTMLNTISNIYVTAMERSSARQYEPLTAIKTFQNCSLHSPIELNGVKSNQSTGLSGSPSLTAVQPLSPKQSAVIYPNTMTATPPLSAGPVDSNAPAVFTFAPAATSLSSSSSSPRNSQALASPIDDSTPRRHRESCLLSGNSSTYLPYTHPRSLHSILRNSPLPSRTAIPSLSPKRQSARFEDRAVKRVEYDSPLEQEITTITYTRSHIDLLVENASPVSPNHVQTITNSLDQALAFTGNEIRDGGQTPGPFEDLRRITPELEVGTPATPTQSVVRKRKRAEKKRQWVWTIGQDDEDEDKGGALLPASRAESGNKRARTPE